MKKKIHNAYKHIRNVIVNPKRYFTKIVADGNMEESMLKAFLYGLLGGCLVLLIRLIGGATITLGSIFTAIIIVPVLAVTLLFVMGGLMMLVSEITGGERDWEIAIKGLAEQYFNFDENKAKAIWEKHAEKLGNNATVEWLVGMSECLFKEDEEVEDNSFLAQMRKRAEEKANLRKNIIKKR